MRPVLIAMLLLGAGLAQAGPAELILGHWDLVECDNPLTGDCFRDADLLFRADGIYRSIDSGFEATGSWAIVECAALSYNVCDDESGFALRLERLDPPSPFPVRYFALSFDDSGALPRFVLYDDAEFEPSIRVFEFISPVANESGSWSGLKARF